MRTFFVLAGLAAAPAAFGQTQVAPASMPGTPTGYTYNVQPVGTKLPQVGTRLPSMGRPASTSTANGLNGNIPSLPTDPAAVVAPYPTSPKAADKDIWDKLYDRWASIFATAPAQQTTYTPGIMRRARERNKDNFRRD